MDTTYLSIVSFLVLTAVYYGFPSIGKMPLTLDMLKSGAYSTYLTSNLPRLGIYVLAILLTQFGINTLYINNTCGGSASTNAGIAFIMTFIPWFFIFGLTIAILIMYPAMKSAFSDVVGYFVVYGKANKILNDILIDTNTDAAIQAAQDISDESKGTMKKAAEAILKLCGNKSILINQIVPDNFLTIWDVLTPLMRKDVTDLASKQQELFDLVVIRENVGEAMWYIYTAILLTSIVSYNLATRGCMRNASQMKANHQQYLDDEQKMNDAKQQAQLNATQYSVGGAPSQS